MTDAWPHPVRLHQVARDGTGVTLSADPVARKRIAGSLDLVSLDALEAEVQVRPWRDGAEVYGRWTATVVQTCSLTADDFETALEGAFTVRCVPPESPLAAVAEPEVEIDPEADDPPDVLEGQEIDVGGYVIEHLALELDPFPRKPGAVFEAPPAAPEPHPFDILARLKPAGAGGDPQAD